MAVSTSIMDLSSRWRHDQAVQYVRQWPFDVVKLPTDRRSPI